MNTIGVQEWNEEGKRLFGLPARKWQFICPACGTVQSGQDLLDAGLPKDDVLKYLAFSCIGRFTGLKGCDWTLGGFLRIHELEVVDEEGVKHPRFEFATPATIEKYLSRAVSPMGKVRGDSPVQRLKKE